MDTVCLTCSICGKQITRHRTEAERNLRMNRRVYCSLSCVGKDNVRNLPKPTKESAAHLPKGRICDSLSPFRMFVNKARMHSKQKPKECTLTVEQVKQIWEDQNGKCPMTGWNLFLPPSTSWKGKLMPYTASLDRIDSEKGYVKENVRFVAVIANFSKNKFSDEDVIDFCEAVTQVHRRSPTQ